MRAFFIAIALLLPDGSRAAGVPAAGGRPFLVAAETAPRVVVGRVTAVDPLGSGAWHATLALERVLVGSGAAGDVLAIAWEEPARERARRFDPATRLLVALEPLPGWSIWRERLGTRTALGVARRGDAFLREPDAASVAHVATFLALSPAERDGPAGAHALASLAAEGAEPLAAAALDRLLDGPHDAAFPPEIEAELRSILLDAARPLALRRALVAHAGRQPLEALRAPLHELARKGALAPDAIEALGQLQPKPTADEVGAWLARPEPAVRAAALRAGALALPRARLLQALREDPEAMVRAAAIEAIAVRDGIDAFALLAPELDAADERVRGAAIRSLGALGEPAVPLLLERARGATLAVARGPVLALAHAGPPGERALRALAGGHADPKVRELATLLLGRSPQTH